MSVGIRLAAIVNALLSNGWKLTKVIDESDVRRWHTTQDVQATNYYYLGPDLALARMRNGLYLYIDPQDESVGIHLISRGYWENWVYSVVSAIVRSGDDVVEVGANFGYYTVAMARQIGPEGSIVSVEANARLAGLVEKSLLFNSLNKRSRVICAAASDAPGRVSFTTSRRNAGGGATTVDPNLEGATVSQVEAVRLDDVIVNAPRFIRIDAEGSEVLILRGAARLLQRPDVIVCVEWDTLQMASRGSVQDLVDWLTGQGFAFWCIEYDGSLRPLSVDQLMSLEPRDIVFSRKEPLG